MGYLRLLREGIAGKRAQINEPRGHIPRTLITHWTARAEEGYCNAKGNSMPFTDWVHLPVLAEGLTVKLGIPEKDAVGFSLGLVGFVETTQSLFTIADTEPVTGHLGRIHIARTRGLYKPHEQIEAEMKEYAMIDDGTYWSQPEPGYLDQPSWRTVGSLQSYWLNPAEFLLNDISELHQDGKLVDYVPLEFIPVETFGLALDKGKVVDLRDPECRKMRRFTAAEISSHKQLIKDAQDMCGRKRILRETGTPWPSIRTEEPFDSNVLIAKIVQASAQEKEPM